MSGSRLCMAATLNNAAAVEEFVKLPNSKKFIDYAEQLHSNRTALHEACIKGYTNIAETLLHYGASTTVFDKDLRSPLHLACLCGHTLIVKLLSESCPIYCLTFRLADKYGLTPLLLACQQNHADIVKILLDRYSADFWSPDVAMHGTRLSWTALHEASSRGHAAALTALLKCSHIPKDAKTAKGMTALHLAVQGGFVDAVDVLCAGGVAIDAKNEVRMTPLHMAVGFGFGAVIDVLIAHGAEVSDNVFSMASQVHDKMGELQRRIRRGVTYRTRKNFLMFLASYQFLAPAPCAPMRRVVLPFRRESPVEKVLGMRDLQRYICNFL